MVTPILNTETEGQTGKIRPVRRFGYYVGMCKQECWFSALLVMALSISSKF